METSLQKIKEKRDKTMRQKFGVKKKSSTQKGIQDLNYSLLSEEQKKVLEEYNAQMQREQETALNMMKDSMRDPKAQPE